MKACMIYDSKRGLYIVHLERYSLMIDFDNAFSFTMPTEIYLGKPVNEYESWKEFNRKWNMIYRNQEWFARLTLMDLVTAAIEEVRSPVKQKPSPTSGKFGVTCQWEYGSGTVTITMPGYVLEVQEEPGWRVGEPVSIQNLTTGEMLYHSEEYSKEMKAQLKAHEEATAESMPKLHGLPLHPKGWAHL